MQDNSSWVAVNFELSALSSQKSVLAGQEVSNKHRKQNIRRLRFKDLIAHCSLLTAHCWLHLQNEQG